MTHRGWITLLLTFLDQARIDGRRTIQCITMPYQQQVCFGAHQGINSWWETSNNQWQTSHVTVTLGCWIRCLLGRRRAIQFIVVTQGWWWFYGPSNNNTAPSLHWENDMWQSTMSWQILATAWVEEVWLWATAEVMPSSLFLDREAYDTLRHSASNFFFFLRVALVSLGILHQQITTQWQSFDPSTVLLMCKIGAEEAKFRCTQSISELFACVFVWEMKN